MCVVCVCVCVCVCARAHVCERECAYVCMCINVSLRAYEAEKQISFKQKLKLLDIALVTMLGQNSLSYHTSDS